ADLHAVVVDALPQFEVQPTDETRDHIDEAARAGLDLKHCPPFREDCALRIGIVGDADYVVTFVVEDVGDRLLLRGGWMSTDGKNKRHVAGELTDKDPTGKKLRALVRRIVTG